MNNKSKIEFILNLIFYLVCALLITVLAVSLVSKKSGEDTSIVGYKFYCVLSESMEPTINKGDLVIVNVDSGINEGDIISFKGINTNLKTTHRVVKVEGINDLAYVTKGDNNSAYDPYKVEATRVQGKVVAWIPLLGGIIDFIRTNLIITMVLMVVTIAITIKIKKKK